MRKFALAAITLAWLSGAPAWADGTIDTLAAGGALTGTEQIPMFQTANPAVKTTPTAIATFLAPLTQILTNKTISCSSNTCTNVPLTGLATQAANSLVGNATGGVASPTALAVGSCSTAGSALNWTTNTGPGCNTAIDAATFNGGTPFGTAAGQNTPAGGFGTVQTITLAPGFTTTVGTQNTGTQTITQTGTLNGQFWPKLVAASCTVNTNCDGANNNSGELLIANAASVTFTLPNPAAGTKGVSYPFGSDGTNGFTLATVGGTANFYGCTPVGAGATTLVVEQNIDVQVVDDGTNYKCTTVGTRTVSYSISYVPGINPNNVPITNFRAARVIVGIRCTPEVAAGGAATISVVKAASGTALSAGTALHSGSCNANGAAATDQDLTLTNTSLAAGDRLGLTTTGTTIWTSSGIATGVVTVFVR